MDNLEKTIIALGILLVIVVAIGYFLPSINGTGKSINSNSIHRNQTAIVSNEIKAIESSSPITIEHWAVFGSGANITKNITYQEQAYFYDNLSNYEIEYNGVYFPISITIGGLLENSTFTNTSLIGQKVYLDFITNNYKNASAIYIIDKIYTKENMFYWILGQDTGISNESAVLWTKNSTTIENSASQLNGVEFLNKTGFISPANPVIYDLLHKTS